MDTEQILALQAAENAAAGRFFAGMGCLLIAAMGAFTFIGGEIPRWRKLVALAWIVVWATPPLGRLWAAAVFQ